MTRWICLLRGVNVLGASKLPMAKLASSMKRLGLKDVKTYIQSGNVIFSCAARTPGPLVLKIRKAVVAAHGVDPHVLLLTKDELEEAALRIPFRDAVADHKTFHLFFLDEKPPRPDIDKLEKFCAPSERFALVGKVFYLHTPQGFAVSRLRGVVERALGVPATARNWRTVTQLIKMARAA